MNAKAELLVFNRKEILVIIVLLVLVALFSFTLGLKMGKSLGTATMAPQQEAPIAEKVEPPGEQSPAQSSAVQAEQVKPAGKVSDPVATEPGKVAEDKADAEFIKEAKKENLGVAKPVPMALPKEKKAPDAVPNGRFTLQVGAYRTVGEAAEMVSSLKNHNLEAFYLEADVPGRGTWYRVGIGLYATKEQAESAGTKLKHVREVPQFIVQKLSE